MQRPVLYNTRSQHTEQSLSHEIKQNVDRNRLKCKTVIVRNLWKGFIECVNGKLHNAQYHLFVHSPWVFKQIIINLLKTGKSRIFNVSSTHKIWCHCIDSWCQLGCHRIGLYNLFICCVVGYTDSCAMLNIPGFTFPVRQFLLEDVLELLQSVLALIMFIDTAHRGCSRVYVTVRCSSVCSSVCLSHSPAAAACGRCAAVGPAGRRSINRSDCCALQQHDVQQQMQAVSCLQPGDAAGHRLVNYIFSTSVK